jgi:prepilin-type N-terminal cleavage/methylation domain-containing protein
MSTAGNWSKALQLMPHESKGYTLIELTVVVFLIGVMLSLAIPRVQYALWSDNLKTATRRMIGTVKTLKNKAVRDRTVYRLYFNMEANRYWVESDAMTVDERAQARLDASGLPAGVRILDVYRMGIGKKDIGDAVIHFTKKGYIEEAVIHLGAKDGRAHTIVLSPFLGTVKTYDRYVEIENT